MTLTDLLVVVFVFGTIGAASAAFSERFGLWAGIAAGTMTAIINCFLVVLFWRWMARWMERRHNEFREKYRGIYRVVVIPNDERYKTRDYDHVRPGDFGWEAAPLRKDNLIYLQGLREDWLISWHAGFRPDEIEYVGPKPCSQYDWTYESVKTPCPFTVQKERNEAHGYPY